MKNALPTNCVLDIETLDTAPTAVILSIGAVLVNESGIYSKFYQIVDPVDCQSIGRTIDADTVMWWLSQPEEARAALREDGMASLKEALNHFADWLPEDCSVWGNGSDFDNAILESSYYACGMMPPWHFSRSRCLRTLRGLYPEIKAPTTPVIKHHAVHDAMAEAEHLRALLAHVRSMY